jgi:hypothetical protein
MKDKGKINSTEAPPAPSVLSDTLSSMNEFEMSQMAKTGTGKGK